MADRECPIDLKEFRAQLAACRACLLDVLVKVHKMESKIDDIIEVSSSDS
jgi:hypothetical protein